MKTFNKNIVLELYSLTDKKTQLWQKAQLTNTKTFELTPENQEIKISSLQVGTYAIRLFQDTNSNGILERTASDIPLEPVGFSQNPSLFGGEPTPEDSAFILSNNQSITISLKHRKPKKKRKNE